MAQLLGAAGFALVIIFTVFAGIVAESLVVSVTASVTDGSTSSNSGLVVLEFGGTAVLNCTTDAGHNYEWMKLNLTTNEVQTVSSSQNLRLSYITISDASHGGYYYCIALSMATQIDVSNVSDVILVVYDPTFFTHPSPTALLSFQGQNVMLECVAAGFPSPTVEWRRIDSNNNLLSLPSNSVKQFADSSNSSSILTISSVNFTDFGLYSCIATTSLSSLPGNVSIFSSFDFSLGSGIGSGSGALFTTLTPQLSSDLTNLDRDNLTASSNATTLTVSPDGSVEVSPSELITTNGSTINITCLAGGGPDNVILWLKDNRILLTNDDVSISNSNEVGSMLTISNVNATEDGGEYRCVVSNAAGNSSDNVTLNVRPVITAQPIETLLTSNGSSEQLVCVADAFPAPDYLWEKIMDGSNTEISDSSTLNFSSVVFGDEGTYQCVAMSLGEEVTSTPTLVVVSPESSIDVQPRNQVVNSSGQALFNCAAQGGPNNMFRWLRSGVNLLDLSGPQGSFNASEFLQSLQAIVVQNGALLSIPSVNASDGDLYTCVVVNEAGYDSDNVTLNIRPIIVMNPTSQLAQPGDTITLTCNAESFPDPVYRWEKLNGTTYVTFNDTNSNMLVFQTVIHDDNGQYRCVASTMDSEAFSDPATLTVSPLGSILVSPANATVDNGSSTTFTCAANGGPGNTIYWIRASTITSSTGLGSGNLQQLINVSSDPTLTISSINATVDGGNYMCVVVNQAGQENASVTLYVRPLIVEQPRNQLTSQGSNATLSCRADSFPSPQYEWEKFNTTSQEFELLTGEFARTLEFNPVEFDDFGEYRCVATAPIIDAEDISSNATVTVAPGVVVSPSTQTTNNGSIISIECLAEGGPENMFQWSAGGDTLTTGLDVSISDGSRLSVLNISNVNATEDGGEYRCVVSNAAGNDSDNATLNVRPVITVQPIETLLTSNGSSEQLVCVADAFPAPEYRWEKFNATSREFELLTGESARTLEFNPVEFDDFGDYRCVTTAFVISAEAISNNATVTVAPGVVVSPSTQTSATVSMECLAEGGPDNMFQWIAGGDTLTTGGDVSISDGSRLSMLSISNVNATEDGGEYRCVVSNAAGNDSDNATLNVRPVITVQPIETLLMSNGSSEQLVCIADAFPAAEYRWEKLIDGRIAVVSNTSTLSFSPVMFGDEGTYQCVAMSLGVEVNSTSTTVFVSPATSVRIIPSTEIVDNGTTARFNCTVSGGRDNTFRWVKASNIGSSSIGSGGSGFMLSELLDRLENITLSLSDLLTIPLVNATEDGGNYTCVVANEAGQGSASATLNVRPLIIHQPQQSSLTSEGQNVTLSCLADSFPRPRYQWEKFNTTSQTFDEVFGETNSTLVFSPVEFDNFGDYRCVATAPVIDEDVESNNATVTVSPAGSVRATPETFNASPNESSRFTCSAEGGPGNTFQWTYTRDNSAVSNEPLLLRTSTAMAGGDYQCRVSNPAGNEAVNVTLNVALEIELNPVSMNVTRTRKVTLECSATGFPAPSITWQHNRTIISETSRVRISSTSSYFQTNSTLTVTMSMTNDSGRYFCTATSFVTVFDSVNSTEALVLVQAIPEQPQNLIAHNVTSRNLTLTWVEPHDNNAPISGYRVSYVQPAFLGGGTVVLNVSADSSVSSGSSQDIANSFLVQIFIDDLHPGATYNFTAIAFNIIGSSEPSAPYNQTMLDEAPGGILNLSADPAATMAILSWDRLAEIEIKARVFNSYFVTLTISRLLAEDNNQKVCLQENSAIPYQEFTRPGVENTSLLVVNLVPHTQYNYTVVANTSFGRGDNISSLSFSSMQAVPTPPTQVNATNTSSTSILITWTRPACDNGILLGYMVRHIANVSDGIEGIPASPHGVGAGVTSVDVTGLTPNTPYIVSVCARTIAGCSLNTSTSITTSQDAPLAVNNLQVTENREGGIITVTWTPPSERNGSISYNLTYSGFQVPPYPPSRALGMSGTFIINEASNVSHQITGALAFARYTINVFAFNKQLGQTAASTTETRAIMTRTISSTGVSGLSFTTLNSTSLLIIWNLPLEPNGNIDRYEVNAVLLRPRSNRKRQAPIVVISGTSATITGLVSGGQYNITVQPFADGVPGEIVSNTTVVNTTAAVPPIVDIPTENIQPFQISVMLPRPSLYGSVVFYAVVVARKMSPGCPADIGSMYPDPRVYSENSNTYITAAWSSTPPNSLSDDTVPAMLTIGNNGENTATKPGRTQITYQNVPLTPGVQYCFFILTRLTTSVPNVYQTRYSELAALATPLNYSSLVGIGAGIIVLLATTVAIVVIVLLMLYVRRHSKHSSSAQVTVPVYADCSTQGEPIYDNEIEMTGFQAYGTNQSLPATIDNDKGEDGIQTTDCAAYGTHQSLPATVDNEQGEDGIQMTDCAAYGTHQSLPATVDNEQGEEAMSYSVQNSNDYEIIAEPEVTYEELPI